MAATTQELEIERRKTLADWAAGLYGIFWSIWWGFFLIRILDGSKTFRLQSPILLSQRTLEVDKFYYVIPSAVIISMFVIVFVDWLWNVHEIAVNEMRMNHFGSDLLPLAITMLALTGSLVTGAWIVQAPLDLVWYGLWILYSWPLAILILLWARPRRY